MPQDPSLEGPFSEQLTQAYRPPPVPLNGYSTPAASIANLATNFIQGMSQARTRQFMQQENQRQQNISTLRNIIADAHARLTPADAARFTSTMVQPHLNAQIANAKDEHLPGTELDPNAKATKVNPVSHFLRTLAQNVTGGASPVKASTLDSKFIGDLQNHLNSAGYATPDQINTQGNQLFNSAWNGARDPNTGMVVQEKVTSHPDFQAMEELYAKHGLQVPPSIAQRMQTAVPTGAILPYKFAENWDKQPGWTGDAGKRNGAEPPTPGAPVATSAAPPAPAAQPPAPQGMALAPAGMVGPPRPADIPAGGQPPIPVGAVPAPAAVPEGDQEDMSMIGGHVGTPPKIVVEQRGPLKSWVFQKRDPVSGALDPSKQIHVNSLGGKYFTNDGMAFDPRKAEKLGWQQLDKAQEGNNIFTPSQIDAYRKATVDPALSNSDLTPGERATAKAEVEGQLQHGDLKGAGATLNKWTTGMATARRSASNIHVKVDAQTAAKAADRAAQSIDGIPPVEQKHAARISKEWENNQIVKNYKTAELNYDSVLRQLDQTKMGSDSGVRQTEMLRMFAKMTHPNQRFTEGEVKAYLSHMGVFPKFEQMLKTGFTTGGFLTPAAKQEFKEMAETVMDSQRKQYGEVYDKYNKQLNAFAPHLADHSSIISGSAPSAAAVEPPNPGGAKKNAGWTPPASIVHVK